MKNDIGKADILKLALQHDIRYVRLQFTDLHGSLKNVEIPVNQLADALDGKIMFDGSSIHGFVRIEESDMYLQPDLSTWLVLPFAPDGAKIARLICNISLPDGRPFSADPRGILQRVVREANELRFDSCRIGVELEFFLLKLDHRNKPTVHPNDQGGYFDIAPTDAGENCRRDIVLTLQQLGISVASSHHETAPGQHEIDLHAADALTIADHITTLKMVARTISRSHGLHATFMPKPLQDEDGSGLHCHLSLGRGQENLFYDAADEYHLSPVARSFIAGLLFHAPAITAITNPLVNSFKRLIPGYEAPAFTFWSTNHRMPFVRVPSAAGAGTDTQIELRSPDASCNPYLAFAAILKAGLDGVSNRMCPPDPIHRSLVTMTEDERFQYQITPLPTSLEQAIEALEEDEIIQDALGMHAFTHFLQAKLWEWEQYRKTIHPWELDHYLERY
ncbi:type I glutamate--ammonia ligase [Alicyclobacillus fastidiosus]|uniref:Glutamine synthetase n=1 Tax=Alicyclobacillus fastidiosus TaxID=392011 RepID=A0ABV5AEH5_9BACL|nr:type I glutamate--ammonia ligase [Alicyclobacillus fastidiosus]WEH09836.1 type I glutamate--ammonia ligase [Alicyclobacillus fastidiosus]